MKSLQVHGGAMVEAEIKGTILHVSSQSETIVGKLQVDLIARSIEDEELQIGRTRNFWTTNYFDVVFTRFHAKLYTPVPLSSVHSACGGKH